ncbi:MAG: hypothetical protein JST47_09785 [Bacteroidetes bacterium]|nr:hypothetical protein [Bacteroidota bacterium]
MLRKKIAQERPQPNIQECNKRGGWQSPEKFRVQIMPCLQNFFRYSTAAGGDGHLLPCRNGHSEYRDSLRPLTCMRPVLSNDEEMLAPVTGQVNFY